MARSWSKLTQSAPTSRSLRVTTTARRRRPGSRRPRVRSPGRSRAPRRRSAATRRRCRFGRCRGPRSRSSRRCGRRRSWIARPLRAVSRPKAIRVSSVSEPSRRPSIWTIPDGRAGRSSARLGGPRSSSPRSARPRLSAVAALGRRRSPHAASATGRRRGSLRAGAGSLDRSRRQPGPGCRCRCRGCSPACRRGRRRRASRRSRRVEVGPRSSSTTSNCARGDVLEQVERQDPASSRRCAARTSSARPSGRRRSPRSARAP